MSIQTVKNVEVKLETIEALTNYIMSVQSLVDRINIEKVDNEYINTRIKAVEKFEDQVLTDLGGIYSK